MATTPQANICDLPNEVIFSIFRLLPIADLARCAATCERWHENVTRSTHLWRGKTYRSNRSPTQCANTRAVLCAMPPFQKVTIQSSHGFTVFIRYPHLTISLRFVSFMNDLPILSCEYLVTKLDIADDILANRSTIDFERLQRLKILNLWSLNVWAPHIYRTNSLVRRAMILCPNLTHFSITTDSLSAEYRDTVQGLGRLLTLEIVCSGLKKLTFLRHCSGTLEDLQLVSCTSLPSLEFAQLRQLQSLRKLRLSHCRFEEGDLAVALAQLGTLESLRLTCCSFIRDLSILQHCGQLQQLRITSTRMADNLVPPMPEAEQLHGLQLPTGRHTSFVCVASITETAEDMSAPLSRLKELGLPSSCLDYLGALRCCPQLRHISCEFICGTGEPDKLNVRIHVTITSSSEI